MSIRVADHPRAARGVRRARAGAGLAGFLLGAYLAHGAGLPGFDVLLRALACGLALHCLGWFAAVSYWRSAILAELETARARREAVLAEARGRADRLMRETAQAGRA